MTHFVIRQNRDITRYICYTFVVFIIFFASNAGAADLLSLYVLGRDQDPRLNAAENAYEAAKQRWPQARAALLPQLEATASYGRNRLRVRESNLQTAFPRTSSSFFSDAYGIELNQTLFNYSAFVNLNRVEAQVVAASFDYEAAKQDLIWRLSSAYFDVLEARDAVDFAKSEIEALEEQLNATRMRLEYGFAPVTSVKETEARYDLAQAEQVNAEREFKNAKFRIREIVGKIPERIESITHDITYKLPPGPESLDGWMMLAEDHNPRLASVRAKARAARVEVKRRRGERYPTVRLVGSYNFQDRTDYAFGRDEETAAIIAQLRLPIFQGGRVSARIREAGHLYERSLSVVENTHREVMRLTEDGYAGVLTEYRRIRAFRHAVASNRTALEASKEGLIQGQRTNLDVLNARRDFFAARRNLSQSRYDLLKERLRLLLASGRLSVNVIGRLNRLLGESGEMQPLDQNISYSDLVPDR